MSNLFHYKQFTIDQSHAAMKVGTDSDLLGTLGAKGNKILDIGTGTGIIALMLAQRCPDAQITAVEIDDQAIIDATHNFAASPFADRLTLYHISFQDYAKKAATHGVLYDSILCNPPYFDQSLECNNLSKTRARHTSSLPFEVLIDGAYQLLKDEGRFSVCIPPEVFEKFTSLCLMRGFWLEDVYQIQSQPQKPPKRYVLIHKKGSMVHRQTHTFAMRNADHTRSDWYRQQLQDFLM